MLRDALAERQSPGRGACSSLCVTPLGTPGSAGTAGRQRVLHAVWEEAPGSSDCIISLAFFFFSPFFLFCLPDGKTKAVVKPVFSQEEVGGNFI